MHERGGVEQRVPGILAQARARQGAQLGVSRVEDDAQRRFVAGLRAVDDIGQGLGFGHAGGTIAQGLGAVLERGHRRSEASVAMQRQSPRDLRTVAPARATFSTGREWFSAWRAFG
jgi:hypothetical protein